MRQIIKEIIEHLNPNPPKGPFDPAPPQGPFFLLDVTFIRENRLRPFLDKFARWLDNKMNIERKRPFLLDPQDERSKHFKNLLDKTPALSDLFEILGNELHYRAEISDSEKNEIREYVLAEYRPLEFITYRRDKNLPPKES